MSPPTHTIRYAITGRTHDAETGPERYASLVTQSARLAAEHIEYIQLREKDLPAQDLIGLAREILSVIAAAGSRTRLLINARADVALAAGAAGVHLPSGHDQLTPAQVRHLSSRVIFPRPDHVIVPRPGHITLARRHSERSEGSPHFAPSTKLPPIVSVSCHTLDEVSRAKKNGADMILFGPVFGKSIAGEIVVPGTGISALKAACDAAGEIPVLALGGVTTANAAACIAAGAGGIAAIRLFR